MTQLLAALKTWPIPAADLERLRETAEWTEARAWGWIMESGELTGSGWRHADELPDGILPVT
jgi:hypothetical protein